MHTSCFFFFFFQSSDKLPISGLPVDLATDSYTLSQAESKGKLRMLTDGAKPRAFYLRSWLYGWFGQGPAVEEAAEDMLVVT